MSSCIKVCVRPRPLDDFKKEKQAPGLDFSGRRVTLGAKSYDPDVLLRPTATQEDVFQHAIPILDAVKDGLNGTILVYGQTGTGKTHTMIGGHTEHGGLDGISMRSIEYLLEHVRAETVLGRRVSLSLSVLEIYNERITDMLVSGGDAEVSLIGGFPRNATSATLYSMDEAKTTVTTALHTRHVSPTAMNDRSSRSHVIFMLDLEEISEDNAVTVSHLFLVDLAGSESIKKSQASGKAAQEAGMINKSLLALKNVILTLSSTSDAAQRPHVPYRDSRLTEVLQDSIGGTARTMFIACVSPLGRDVDETKSTLDYATKARTIRNVSSTERDKLQIKIRGLEMDLVKHKNRLERLASEKGGFWVSKDDHEAMQNDAERIRQLEADVKNLQQDLAAAKAQTNVSKSQISIYSEILAEKEAYVQGERVKLARAFAAIQDVLCNVESAQQSAVERARSAVAADHEAAVAAQQDFIAMVKSPSFVQPHLQRMDDMWVRLNDRHQYVLGRMEGFVNEIAEAATNVHAMQHVKLVDVVGDRRPQAEEVHRVSHECKRELQDAIDTVRGSMGLVVARRDLTDRDPERALVSDLTTAVEEAMRRTQPSAPSDATNAAFAAAHQCVRGFAGALVRDGLKDISGVCLSEVLARAPSGPSDATLALAALQNGTEQQPATGLRSTTGTTTVAPSDGGDALSSAAGSANNTPPKGTMQRSSKPPAGPPRRPGLSARLTNTMDARAGAKRSRSSNSEAALEGTRRGFQSSFGNKR